MTYPAFRYYSTNDPIPMNTSFIKYPITLFLADDHKLITDAWTGILNADRRFRVIGSANNSANALSLITQCHPDIVLLDISMTPIDGYELTRSIKECHNHIQVIAVSYFDMPSCFTKILKAGASGYVTKTSSIEELKEAIVTVHMGEKYACSEINQNIVRQVLRPDEMTAAIKSLTTKQLSIIDYLKKGFSSKEIASLAGISRRTVEIHRYNIMKKLGLKNIAALINEMNARGI
ncbi:response regulator transcription factor [Terrimonas pollutisoli]|uniref:response regulator transcription factor n=1 Tax=Terrimonas pollutisoli TaxID=3034147 RepID=UPI0023EC2BAF|nr:response regulator transcription factor [Terrimonas sp. H1YJ31]